MLNNISAERARKHLTQTEIAKKLGISARTYFNYEKGRRQIPSDILVKMSEIFECRVDYLLGIDNPKTA